MLPLNPAVAGTFNGSNKFQIKGNEIVTQLYLYLTNIEAIAPIINNKNTHGNGPNSKSIL